MVNKKLKELKIFAQSEGNKGERGELIQWNALFFICIGLIVSEVIFLV